MRDVRKGYFDWLCDLVGGQGRYEKLLWQMFNTDFEYLIEMDGNRAEDGIDLRYRYGEEVGLRDAEVTAYLDCDECSVFEMMVALAVRCEEHIMVDDEAGDRTREWFWEMVDSMGLAKMTDERYYEGFVEAALYEFVNRLYSPNGHGGLFTLKKPPKDLRTVEIWYQAMWYLTENYG